MRCVFVILLLSFAQLAFAQSAANPALALTASPKAGPAPLATILSWSTIPAATSCIAEGGLNWSGALKPVGTLYLTLSVTQYFVMACTWRAISITPDVIVSWTAPTENTDGSPLTNLTGYNVYMDSVNPPQKIVGSVASGVTSYTIDNPKLGTVYFAVTAVSATGTSPLSTVASFTVANQNIPSITKSAFLGVTVSKPTTP